MSEQASITGVITRVKREVEFTIHCPNIDKHFTLISRSPIELKKDDVINADCDFDSILTLNKICYARSSGEERLQREAYKFFGKSTHLVLKKITSQKDVKESPSEFVDRLSNIMWDSKYRSDHRKDEKEREIASMIKPSSGSTAKIIKFLKWWNYEYNLRYLYLIGVSDREIIDSSLLLGDFVSRYKENPFAIPSLTMDRCIAISNDLGLEVTESMKINGTILRMVHKDTKNGHCGTSLDKVSKVFFGYPNFSLNNLEDYDLAQDSDTIYPKSILDRELRVASFLSQLISDKREPPKLSLDGYGLSKDQEDAVIRSLSNPVSIITGAAGTGKCLSPYTKVIKSDGSMVMVKDLKIGDHLLSPSFSARYDRAFDRLSIVSYQVITSMCEGYDDMVRVIPDVGLPFECNMDHILVLRKREILEFKELEITVADYLRHKKSLSEYKLFHHLYDSKDTSFNIVHLGLGPYVGFTLDGDGRFLLENYIVTHNTTCIRTLVDILSHFKFSFVLCSFTGKAASRITEVTGHKAYTIHRLILTGIEFEYVIIDEASMVTIGLFYRLIKVFPDIKNVILIGDDNQLQPIDWGSLMKQLIKSSKVPISRLLIDHRCSTGISTNANRIINNIQGFVPTDDFNIIQGSIEDVKSLISKFHQLKIKKEDFIILSPYNRGLLTLSNHVRNTYFISPGIWIIDDLAMMTENDYEADIYNGEVGKVIHTDDEMISVQFQKVKDDISSNKLVNFYYSNNDSDKKRSVALLEHAYALTVDKSQGSEWNYVIFYVEEFCAGNFINRNRIYTALTRAKKAIWVITSDIKKLETCCISNSPDKLDNLWKRI